MVELGHSYREIAVALKLSNSTVNDIIKTQALSFSVALKIKHLQARMIMGSLSFVRRYWIVVVLAALLCVMALSVRAQVSTPTKVQESTVQLAKRRIIPNTLAGKHLAEWLSAFNTGDVNVLNRFHAEHDDKSDRKQFSAQARALMDALLYKNTGGLNLYRLEKSNNEEIVALAQARLTEEWARITLTTSKELPNGIVDFRTQPLARPVDIGPHRKLSDAEIAQKLDTYLYKLVAADRFSGAVLLAKDGKRIFKKAYGQASRAYNAPNHVDTKFNLASMGKMFTGVAIAQLVEQGKLSFNEPIVKILPDYSNKQVAEDVTIHHLLTHTSGLGNAFNDKFIESSKDRYRTLQDYLPLFVNEPLSFKPGEKYQYSNAGFIVLGLIIEKVSRQNYFDYVREHIFKPAGMTNTDAYELDQDIPNLALGYTYIGSDGKPTLSMRKNNLFMNVIKGSSAGGSYSTVEDLLKFDLALCASQLLSPKFTDIVLTGKVDETQYFGWFNNLGTKDAYGFSDQQVNGTRIVGHGGIFPGVSSTLDMYLELGYTVAVMSNYDSGAIPVSLKLQEMITQK